MIKVDYTVEELRQLRHLCTVQYHRERTSDPKRAEKWLKHSSKLGREINRRIKYNPPAESDDCPRHYDYKCKIGNG